jgi:hypothetical protein
MEHNTADAQKELEDVDMDCGSDWTLLKEELMANAGNTGQIPKMARTSMEDDSLDGELPLKKRRVELAMTQEEIGIEERKLSIEERKLALEERKVHGKLTLEERREHVKLTLEERKEHGKLTLEERKLIHSSSLLHAMGSINTLMGLANVDDETKMRAKNHVKNLLFNSSGTKPTETLAQKVRY